MPSRHVVAVAAAALAAGLVAGCSPPETALTPDEIVAAFIAESQDDARTFHMEWRGTTTTTDPTAAPGAQKFSWTFSASFDCSGHDLAGTITTRSIAGGAPDPTVSTTAYVRVGGAMFVRYNDAGWQRAVEATLPLPGFDPLRGLTVADVAYEAPDTVDEQALHRLRILDPTAAMARFLFSLREFREPVGDSAEYLIYVDGRGVPVRAHLLFDGRIVTIIPGEEPVPGIGYDLTADYQFSAWGEVVVIRPPM